LLFLLSTSWSSYAQHRDLRFEHLSPRQGLPNNWVWSISQDKEGFLWIGTYDGLYKYDGQAATSYGSNPADPLHSLRSNIISDIHEDRKGRLWVATWGGGLHQVDKRTGKARAYPVETRQSSQWDQLNSIYEDHRGILWLGTYLGIARFDPGARKYTLYPAPKGQFIGLIREDAAGKLWSGSYRFDPKTGQFTLFPLLTPSGPQLVSRIGFHIDADGVAWLGTYADGLFRLDTRRPGHYTSYNPKGLINKPIIRIWEADDHLWLGTTQGLQCVNKKTNQVLTYQSDPSQPGSLSSNMISSIYQDKTGNLWVGTGNGVNKTSTRARPFRAYQIIPAPAAFHRTENEIFSVLEDRYGTVWVSSGAKGLHRMDPGTHQFSRVVVNPLEKPVSLLSQGCPLVEDQQGRLWVATGTEKALYRLDRTTGKFIRYPCRMPIRMLDKDASGKLWLGGLTSEMASFDPLTSQFTYYKANEKDSTGLMPGFINDLMVSRTGEVWMATTTGVGRMNPKTGLSIQYKPSYHAPAGGLNDHHAMALYEDQAGIIWIGTHGGGLNRLDPGTNIFTYFTTRQGLPSNRIMSLIGDEQGNLWIGTGNGLSRFNPRTNTFRNFDASDGLPGNEFLERGSVYSRQGKLLFGNKKGLLIFYPDSIKDHTTPLPVYITGFKVLEQSRPVPVRKIELPYDENFLSFEFVAINYEAPDKNQYAYQLVGLNKDWVNSGNSRVASYTDLSPGTYQFRVKATSDGSNWKEAASSIQITIHPPWWRTYWAYGLYGLAFIATLYGLIHYTVSRERLQAHLKLKSIESEKLQEVDKLKSHFFANISHEFRTPLTLILAPLEKLMASAKDDAQQLRLYRTMYGNARRLLNLINQLLDLSRLEAGKMHLELTQGNLMQAIRRSVLSFSSLAERRHIRLEFQYPGERPLAYFDADKLEKIIANLLSNALKFTPEGGEVVVTARLDTARPEEIPKHITQRDKAASFSVLQLEVQDNGLGIPPDRLDKIFDRFYQIDPSSTREQEGSGIGLSLVKELVELQEGAIWAESTPGIQTCFRVRLPVLMAGLEQMVVAENDVSNSPQPFLQVQEEHNAVADKAAEAPMPPTEEDAPLVLLVEDNADLRDYMRETLQAAYKIIEAPNGLEGYRQALETIPDLVVSDIMMPKMDGLELCQKLKLNEKTSHIPVVLLTAKANSQSRIEGLQTGADDYIIKPFEIAELEVRIKNLIAGRRKLREHFSREITLQPAAIVITSVDERFLQRVMQVMEANMADANFGVEDLGREIGMSRMQLYRKLQALTDLSPSDFMKKMRLQRAAQLLLQGSGNVSEISYQVGFSSHAYFSKCFHDQYGKTPSEFLSGQAGQK
jgi:signal transduction histidine kinase/ligand-binding sensor domain-containing protein/DNA-binding response OmpR family regulator